MNNIPNELMNKIIMMSRPIYPYFNELSCRLNMKVKTQIIEHINDWGTKDYGPIRYYRIYGYYEWEDLLEYRDNELEEYGELSKLWE